MAQHTSGARAVLSHPWAYDAVQALFGGTRYRQYMQDAFIQAAPGERVLDVGCGTAEILRTLPDVEYVGFDVSEPYIQQAQARWGHRGQFHAQPITRDTLAPHGAFDLIIVGAVLHHLDDDEARTLFVALAEHLKPGGRVVTIDCCYADGQSRIAKFLIDHDRGQNVREPSAYTALARPAFGDVQGWLIHRAWIPYTYWIMRARTTSR